jgi:hypothetical protein
MYNQTTNNSHNITSICSMFLSTSTRVCPFVGLHCKSSLLDKIITMNLVLVSSIVLALLSVCKTESNVTVETSQIIDRNTVQRHQAWTHRTCIQCSPCWNLFNTNYGPCSIINPTLNLPTRSQSICMDGLILLILLCITVLGLLPTCIWLIYRWVQRCRDTDTKFIINGLIIAWQMIDWLTGNRSIFH